MSKNFVNLDALIPRADMAEASDLLGSQLEKIDIRHLDDHFFVDALRKPDFQRETVHWSPEKVFDLIRAFVDGDLIPAVILWQRGRHVFVIDGAHRLGALIAWVRDDYGDQRQSQEYFGGYIPDEQKKAADKTRKLVNSTIGPYGAYSGARKNPANANPQIQTRLGNLAVNSFVAQWVRSVDEKAAENSFFKINQAATPIDPTERRILKARQSPNAVAARAIVRGGTGHKYWATYPGAIQAEIETLAKELQTALYEPPITSEGPIKTMDLPVAGRGYNALPFVFDLVNWANGVPHPAGDKDDKALPPDLDGRLTVDFLKEVRRIVQMITGNNPSSLGLHPVVYFYTRGGEFQPTAFLAATQFVKELGVAKRLPQITKARRRFEDFLIGHKENINLTVKRTGSGFRSLNRIARYFDFVFQRVSAGNNDLEIQQALNADQEFSYLGQAPAPKGTAHSNPSGRFSRATKSASFLDSALASGVRCAICDALVHRNSMQIDHQQRRSEGGKTDASNARVTHPYCNSSRG